MIKKTYLCDTCGRNVLKESISAGFSCDVRPDSGAYTRKGHILYSKFIDVERSKHFCCADCLAEWMKKF